MGEVSEKMSKASCHRPVRVAVAGVKMRRPWRQRNSIRGPSSRGRMLRIMDGQIGNARLHVVIEAQSTTVPSAMGTSGTSVFNEHNLGGLRCG